MPMYPLPKPTRSDPSHRCPECEAFLATSWAECDRCEERLLDTVGPKLALDRTWNPGERVPGRVRRREVNIRVRVYQTTVEAVALSSRISEGGRDVAGWCVMRVWGSGLDRQATHVRTLREAIEWTRMHGTEVPR